MPQVDYLIQVTKLPDDLSAVSNQPDSELYDNYRAYLKLVEGKLLWKVWQIDDYGQIWLELNFVNDAGEAEFHTLVIDPGTYRKVAYDAYEILPA